MAQCGMLLTAHAQVAADPVAAGPFFGTDAYLTVSAQLHGEAFCCALSKGALVAVLLLLRVCVHSDAHAIAGSVRVWPNVPSRAQFAYRAAFGGILDARAGR